MPDIVIIGAGISGLSAAYRIQNRMPHANITILEKNATCGGTVRTDTKDGFRVEAGPNGFLDNKKSTLELCHDLGLKDRLVPGSEAAKKNRYLFLGNGLKMLPNSFGSFLRSDLMSWRGKLSLVMERFRKKNLVDTDESIDAFARRRAGSEAADLLADAMVTGIYAGDPQLLSISATFPRVAELEKQHGSVIKGFVRSAKEKRLEAQAKGENYVRGSKMWSFREGLTVLIDALVSNLKSPPVTNVEVRNISRSDDGKRWQVFTADNRSWQADTVILASPAFTQADILQTLDDDLAKKIRTIPYNRVVVVAMGYDQADIPGKIDGFGFIAPQRTRRDILGVQWCSSIYPGRAPDGKVLLRAMCGGWHRPEIVDWDDQRLIDVVGKELQLAMGITAKPEFSHIVRWHKAIPQYHLGHLERVREIENKISEFPGLFLAGNAYHGVALNDCTEQGTILAEKTINYLQSLNQ